MVVIAAGRFLMGSPDNEPERSTDEGPQHGVAVQNPFALGRCEVRVGEFRAFIDDTGYRTEAERPVTEGGAARGCYGWDAAKGSGELRPEFNWRNPGFTQGDDHPVVCVSWNDGRAYAHWLSLRTGQPYRLPTEAEWEYAARAGTTTPFSIGTGNCINTDQANYDGNSDYNGCGAKTGVYRRQTLPVGSLPPNPWGLHEVAGNVWEWVADCWHKGYQGAPIDGSAWGEAGGGDCARRVVRGGGWDDFPRNLRSAARNWGPAGGASGTLGLRLARTL
jgi:formylglycine-generating enzyme required for sulfatase activity